MPVPVYREPGNESLLNLPADRLTTTAGQKGTVYALNDTESQNNRYKLYIHVITHTGYIVNK